MIDIVNIERKSKHCHTKNSTNTTVYNGIMPHQCINIYNVMFTIYFIAMASNSNPSSSEDNTSGTDLSNIHTEEEQIDTTDWTSSKMQELQHMVEFHEEYQHVFWRKSIHSYYNEK